MVLERAIQQVANELGLTLHPEWLARATLVPIPPSKVRTDPLYDDRMERTLRKIPGARDVGCLIRQRVSVEAAHQRDIRPRLAEVIDNYELDEASAEPPPVEIALFDDVLTTGAHFRAAKHHLERRFPGAPIRGIFIARRCFPPAGEGEAPW